ncbi:MAG: S-layer homology domain-containing protein [Clostridia bacterium]|nr:S-layer homology domain-containing protein [Clostridia bacterium]
MNIILKKTVAIVLLVAMLITHTPIYVIAATDTTPPSVVISGLSSSTVAYQGESMSFKVYFSDETAMGDINFNANYVMLVGFTGNVSVSGSGNPKTVTISNINDNSTTANKVMIRAAAAKDAAGNTSKSFSSSAFTITARPDTTKPSVVVSKPSVSSVVEGGSVSYTVTFSDNKGISTNNFNSNYVSLTGFNANISVSGSGNTRTVTLTNVQGAADSDNKISIRANAVKDAAGNGNSAVTSTAFTITAADTTRPSVVISKPSVSSVVEGGSVSYTVTFSDNKGISTNSFSASYVALTGFSANVSVSGSGNTRTVTLTNVQGAADSDNKISIRANAVKDAAGNGNSAVTSTTFAITAADTTKPSVVISKPSPTTVEQGGTVKYTVSFADETKMGTVNFNENYVALIGFTGNVSVTGTGNTRYVTISNITGVADSDNKITIRANAAKDASGNGTIATNSTTFTIVEPVRDTTKPSVVISKPTPMSITEGGTVKYTVAFSDETAMGTINFNENYVALIGFTANVSVSGSGNTRTVTLTNVQGAADSDNKITIRANAAKDAAGNGNVAVSSTTFTITAVPKDTTRPSIIISKPSPISVNEGGTVKYTVVFSDETAMGTINFNENYVSLVGFDANVSVSGSGNTRTVTLTNVQGAADSDNKIVIRAGAAKDAAGNSTVATTSTTFTIVETIKDATRPSVVISKPSPMTVEVGGTVSYTVMFSDETKMGTINFNENYVALIGFSANVSVTGTGNSRVVTLSNIQGDADSNNRIAVRAGAAADAAGNKTVAVESTNFTVTIPAVKDVTPPSVIISNPNPTITEVGGTVKYTVAFSDETKMGTINFNENYVALIGFSANISVSGSGNTRTVTLSNIQGGLDSDNRIAVRAGAAQDAAGNKTKVVESTNFKVIAAPVKDTTVPSVTISAPKPGTIELGETVKYTVKFSDETKMGAVHFNKSYVQLIGFTANVIVTGDGNTRTVTLTNVQGAIDSDNRILVLAGAAEDAAGNKTKAVESTNFTIVKTEERDSIPPVVKITSVKPETIYANGTVKYTVTFADNIKVTEVNLYASKIKTMGFDADVSVKMNGVKSAEITLKNIKGTVGNNKYIVIASGVALDAEGNRSKEATGPKFSIIEKANPKPDVPTKPGSDSEEDALRPIIIEKVNCIDDLKLIGDINKEIDYFASWLKTEKDENLLFPQEQNYVAKNDEMTYIVEYFNGSTATAENVKFELTIPYGVKVLEINGGGKVTSVTDDATIVTWNMGNIKAYAASAGTGYCRLYVKVKFLQNVELESSKNISEVFFATLKTVANDSNSYSYMRQLFIDLTEGKVGTYNKSLVSIDALNEVRPNEEITRAEFAKLLADAGIIEVDYKSKAYKNFKDYEMIPSYARAAVAALAKAEIIKPYADGTFKPYNPILMEDAMQILAEAAAHMTNQKLAVSKPVFLYTEALTGKDGEVSPKKDYIMELMRQNVISSDESNPDSYVLRREAVEMVNSLAFRGPAVQTLEENELKFAKVRENNVVFYNVVEAMEKTNYVYDYKLWQDIVDIK